MVRRGRAESPASLNSFARKGGGAVDEITGQLAILLRICQVSLERREREGERREREGQRRKEGDSTIIRGPVEVVGRGKKLFLSSSSRSSCSSCKSSTTFSFAHPRGLSGSLLRPNYPSVSLTRFLGTDAIEVRTRLVKLSIPPFYV